MVPVVVSKSVVVPVVVSASGDASWCQWLSVPVMVCASG